MKSRTLQLIDAIFQATAELEEIHERSFTPDGHLVGSLGEAIAAARYGLKLAPPSTKGYDATTTDGRRVEIKATFANRGVALRQIHADMLVVLRLSRDGEHEEVYHGPADQAWARAGAMQSNGQRTVSLAQLRWLGQRQKDRNEPMIFAEGTGIDLGDLKPGDPDFIRKACEHIGAHYQDDTTSIT